MSTAEILERRNRLLPLHSHESSNSFDAMEILKRVKRLIDSTPKLQGERLSGVFGFESLQPTVDAAHIKGIIFSFKTSDSELIVGYTVKETPSRVLEMDTFIYSGGSTITASVCNDARGLTGEIGFNGIQNPSVLMSGVEKLSRKLESPGLRDFRIIQLIDERPIAK